MLEKSRQGVECGLSSGFELSVWQGRKEPCSQMFSWTVSVHSGAVSR